MNCANCKHRYLGRGWICWSGNKLTLDRCNNGNPNKSRVVYKDGKTATEKAKDGDNSPEANRLRQNIENSTKLFFGQEEQYGNDMGSRRI